MASKAFRIICDAVLGKPHAFLTGRNSVRSDDDAGGRGYGKKQMVTGNRLHRGVSALIRTDADFPLVSHGMNRDKPMNMRKSITLKCEMLIDTKKNVLLGCKLELLANNAAHEGHGMLEPDAVKVARPVLRRGGGSNLSFLFDLVRCKHESN